MRPSRRGNSELAERRGSCSSSDIPRRREPSNQGAAALFVALGPARRSVLVLESSTRLSTLACAQSCRIARRVGARSTRERRSPYGERGTRDPASPVACRRAGGSDSRGCGRGAARTSRASYPSPESPACCRNVARLRSCPRHYFPLTLTILLAVSDFIICRATAAATGGGNAFPTCL